MNKHADKVFGPDEPDNLSSIALAIRGVSIRTLPENTLADVMTMMEFMQSELNREHAAVTQAGIKLEALRTDLVRRERELSLRQRAVEHVTKITPQKSWGFGWRRGGR